MIIRIEQCVYEYNVPNYVYYRGGKKLRAFPFYAPPSVQMEDFYSYIHIYIFYYSSPRPVKYG